MRLNARFTSSLEQPSNPTVNPSFTHVCPKNMDDQILEPLFLREKKNKDATSKRNLGISMEVLAHLVRKTGCVWEKAWFHSSGPVDEIQQT